MKERDRSNLLTRAAAALETPGDLTPEDKKALIEDLTTEARDGVAPTTPLKDAGMPEYEYTVRLSVYAPSKSDAADAVQTMLETDLLSEGTCLVSFYIDPDGDEVLPDEPEPTKGELT